MKKIWESVKKAWHYAKKENKVLSWVIDVIIAILLIQFIIYPLLGFALSTDLPIVAVVSSSMEHGLRTDGDTYFMCGRSYNESFSVDFDMWWRHCGGWYRENTNITKQDFADFRFSNGFNEGDVMIIRGKSPRNIQVGDVIVFNANRRALPIIHRVVDIYESGGQLYFAAKGDNNPDIHDALGEDMIHPDDIRGVATGRVPYVGYIKIFASRLFGS